MKACGICGTVRYDDGHEETLKDVACAYGYELKEGWFSRLMNWIDPCPHDWINVTNPSGRSAVRSRRRHWHVSRHASSHLP
jgi:hypothetical protein